MTRIISKKRRCGKLITNGVILELHEQKTVNLLLMQGNNIELIPKSNHHGMHTPDIKMQGLEWEMKCPKGRGKYVIQNILHKAVVQSENIIIDLHRIRIPQMKCLAKIKKEFELTRRMKRIRIITKSQGIIDLIK